MNNRKKTNVMCVVFRIIINSLFMLKDKSKVKDEFINKAVYY